MKFLVHTLWLLAIFFCQCGVEQDENSPVLLEGRVSFEADKEDLIATKKPIFVMAFMAASIADVWKNPDERLIAIGVVNPLTREWQLDFSSSALNADDPFVVIAFQDNDYDGGVPKPTADDMLGVFLANGTQVALSMGLVAGRRLNIAINRQVFEYEKELSGELAGDYKGAVSIILHKGRIPLTALTYPIDAQKVLAEYRGNKVKESINFKLVIPPFGWSLPVDDVYAYVLLDKNNNGQVDALEWVTWYGDDDSLSAKPMSITRMAKQDLGVISIAEERLFRIPKPAVFPVEIDVDLKLPPSLSTTHRVDVYVAKAGSLTAVLDDPLKSIKAMASRFGAGVVNIPLGHSDLMVAEEVIIFAVWRYRQDALDPLKKPISGDFVGAYHNLNLGGFGYRIQAGKNDIKIVLDRPFRDTKKVISGELVTGYLGPLKVLASTQPVMSIAGGLDLNLVLGYSQFVKTGPISRWVITILPFGPPLPLADVYLYVLQDGNGNGIPDPGERVSWMSQPQSIDKRPVVQEFEAINLTEHPSMTIPSR